MKRTQHLGERADQLSGTGHPARWMRQPAAEQHLPAYGAGRVVRERGQAAAKRASVSDPLCRRLRDGI